MDLVLVPGGEVQLGVGLSCEEVVALFPIRQLARFELELDDLGEDSCTTYRDQLVALYNELARPRTVTVAPFAIERVPVRCGRDYGSTFAAIREGVAREGFRLPTVDEWELAYGAGTQTLFPWGNTWYPPAQWKHPYGLASRVPHTDTECTAIERVFVGGDGGCLSCGGSHFAHITHASAFVCDRRDSWDPVYDERIWYGSCAVRRVKPA